MKVLTEDGEDIKNSLGPVESQKHVKRKEWHDINSHIVKSLNGSLT